MNLEKIIVELRYKEPAYPFTFRSKIIKEITGSDPNNSLHIQEGITIQISDKKAKLVLEPQRWAVSIEEVADTDGLVSYLQTLYSKVYSAVQWKESVQMGVRTTWLAEFDGSFEDYSNQFKEKLFNKSELVTESRDIALPLTFYDGENRVNYVAGPMMKEELRGRFEAKLADDLPDAALFVDLDYITAKERVCDKAYFRKVLTTSMEYSAQKASQTENELL